MFFGLIALFLGYKGHDWLAGIVFATTVISVGGVFVLNKKPNGDAPKQDSQDIV